jgi:hypothetical protein
MKQERRMQVYNIASSGRAQNGNTQSKRLAIQALYYVGAFFAAWIFPTIYQLAFVTRSTNPFWLVFICVISIPVQGFFNLLVFVRPKFLRYQKDNPNEFRVFAFFRCLRSEITGTSEKTGRSNISDTSATEV